MRERQKQIPYGDNNKKINGKSKSNSNSNGKGNCRSKRLPSAAFDHQTFYFYFSELSGINMQRLLHGDFAVFCCGSGDFHGSEGLTTFFQASDAEVVGAPAGDGLLDDFGLQVLSERALNEGGEFGVGGEAEGKDLTECE